MSDARDQLPKDLSLPQFRQFRDYIHDHSGIYLEESKLDSLRISLVTRATRLDTTSWDDYLRILSYDEAEFRELMSLVTINETSFFRFPAQFEVLRTRIIPEIAAEAGADKRTMRFWSAGCSTGEEPYSIAMSFLDSGLETFGWRGEVVGSDVSTKALGVARQGVYPSKAVLNVPEETVSRHFRPADGDRLVVAPAPRRICEFSYHNLIKEPYAPAYRGNWDIIFCRNVTIYFRLESTRRVVGNFFESLNEGGYLFIGHSETLSSISDDFEVVETGGVFVYRKPRTTGIFAPGAADRASGHRVVDRLGAARSEAPGAAGSRARPARSVTPPGPERPDDDGSGPDDRPSSADLLAEARAEMIAGRSEAALGTVETVLVSDPNNSDAHLLAAHLHADLGDYQRALADCTRALAINPLLPGARYVLGVIHQRQGDTVRAISELKKTIYIDPDFVLAHMNLGNIYKAQGRFDTAAREYENALRALYKNPTGSWTLYLGGWQPDLIVSTCERSLLECRKAMGAA